MKRLRDLGEDPLIERLLKQVPTDGIAVGPGDDCAVVEQGKGPLLLLKTDAVVENVHYLPEHKAQDVGWKAIARVVSDFAAMGGEPKAFLITLALPLDCTVAWCDGLYRGIGKCVRTFGGIVAGGETTRVPNGSAAVITISATGEVERKHLVTRSGGRPGDLLFVTGKLGGSFTSQRHLKFTPRLKEAAWLVRHAKPNAMMDLSDGLAKDLPRLAKASGCGFTLKRKSLPLHRGVTTEQALGDGEDFELLFALSAKRAKKLLETWPRDFPALACIGTLTAEDHSESLAGGWDPFAA